ncbi:MAG: hypothetical protein AB1401_05025 [Thermodesulfobacteriota bacterium]
MKSRTIITCIIFIAVLTGNAVGGNLFFATIKKGDIRSGPGINYKIVGKVNALELLELPEDFTDYNAEWIPIETKIKYTEGERQGWYSDDLDRETLSTENLQEGKELTFFAKINFDWVRERGFLLKILPETKKLFGNYTYQAVLYKTKQKDIVYTKYLHCSIGKIGRESHDDNLKLRIATIRANPTWSNEMIKIILNEKIKLGMTKEQIVASWGYPKSINRNVGSWGIYEQWVYGNSVYLYLENGILKSFQD